MTRKEFESKTFDELIEQLNEEKNDIHDRETLKDIAKHFINEDDFYLVKHIINGLDDYAEWYWYDVSMGTLDEITALTCKEDIEHLIED